MEYLTFEQDRKYDLILLGRIAIDFNPLDYYKTLAESGTFRKYVGGSPANIAVGLSRLGKKCGFFARISHDRFGEFVVNFFNPAFFNFLTVSFLSFLEEIMLTRHFFLFPNLNDLL